MKNLKRKLLSRRGAVTIEYVLVIVLVVLALVSALTFFSDTIIRTLTGQSLVTEKSVNDKYCAAQTGMKEWTGVYVDDTPTCK